MPDSPSASSHFDIVIVGAGPAGLAAGAQAARRGLSHVVLERSALANTIVKFQKRKHVMAEPSALPLHGEISLRFEASSREEVLERWAEGTKAAGTNVWVGPGNEVTAIGGTKGSFEVGLKDGRTLTCGSVVLSMGLQGNLRTFGVPGDDLPHVTYQLDDPDEHVDKRVVVVGVGDAGIENALALAKKNEVTVLNRMAEIDRAKLANRNALEAQVKSGQIRYLINTAVKRFEPSRAIVETPDGEVALDADLVIGRLGALPPRKFLEGLGIKFPTPNPDAKPGVKTTFESVDVPGLYVVGALAGYDLIKQCLNQGFEVVEWISGNPVAPADEPLLQAKFKGLTGSVNEVLDRIRRTIPVFSSLSDVQLRELLADPDAALVRAAARQVVYQRNDFSDEFYAILDGTVEVIAPATDADADSIYGDPSTRNETRIPLGPGNFFGEGSLLSGRRRTATVVSRDGCILVKIPRKAMTRLVKSVPEVRRAIDEAFIVRKLQNTLAPTSPIDELHELATAAVVETFKPGELVFEEGAPSNGLHVIRRGAVSVSVHGPGRERILAYLPAGNVVGEMALFSPSGKRTASVRATTLTETIRLPSEAILGYLERHEALATRLQELASQRLIENARGVGEQSSSDLVAFLMSAGAGEATDLLLIDESLCVRCDNCEKACADTHGGVSRLDREAGPTFASVHVPTSCRHCENPKCMTDCPPDALRRHPNGEVYVLDNCIGCGNCASFCPYGVIQMAAVDPSPRPGVLARLLFGLGAGGKGPPPDAPKHAVKCDLCRGVPGFHDGPGHTACVSACPTGAVVRVNPKKYVDQILPR